MAQLTDSCFNAGEKLLPLEEALAHLQENLHATAHIITCSLNGCLNHILAEDIYAIHNVPPYINSAVDGYAVNYQDLDQNNPTMLPVTARVAAGEFLDRPITPNEAIRIFTGAPLPVGVDTVMMQEDATETIQQDQRLVTLLPGIKKGANTRPAGEDMTKGSLLLKAGQKLQAPQIAIAAAQGYKDLKVYKKLKIGVFSTGNEVTEPGTPLKAGGIYDANRPMLFSLLQGWGCDIQDLGILPDQPSIMKNAFLDAAQNFDLLISSAGMSVGEEDHLCRIIQENGQLNFWKLAIKPGRPVGMGLIQSEQKSTPVLGLPGNPVAAFLTCGLIGRAIIQILSGMPLKTMRDYPCMLAEDFKSKEGRDEFLRAAICGIDSVTHLPMIRQYGQRGAAILTSLEGADGFVLIDRTQKHPQKGTKAKFLPIEGFLTL